MSTNARLFHVGIPVSMSLEDIGVNVEMDTTLTPMGHLAMVKQAL